MCVNNLSKVALDSAAAGIEPAISSRTSNALTTIPPSHTPHPTKYRSFRRRIHPGSPCRESMISHVSCHWRADKLRQQSLQCSWNQCLELAADKPPTAGLVMWPMSTGSTIWYQQKRCDFLRLVSY